MASCINNLHVVFMQRKGVATYYALQDHMRSLQQKFPNCDINRLRRGKIESLKSSAFSLGNDVRHFLKKTQRISEMQS